MDLTTISSFSPKSAALPILPHSVNRSLHPAHPCKTGTIDRRTPFDADTCATWLDVRYGVESGVLHMGTIGSDADPSVDPMRFRYFTWPTQRTDALVYCADAHANGKNIYAAVHLTTHPDRTSTPLPTQWLWIDDADPTIHTHPACVAVIATSAHSRQAWLRCDRPMSETTRQVYTRTIKQSYTMDSCSYLPNPMTRMPCGYNTKRKYPHPVPVRIEVYKPDTLRTTGYALAPLGTSDACTAQPATDTIAATDLSTMLVLGGQVLRSPRMRVAQDRTPRLKSAVTGIGTIQIKDDTSTSIRVAALVFGMRGCGFPAHEIRAVGMTLHATLRGHRILHQHMQDIDRLLRKYRALPFEAPTRSLHGGVHPTHTRSLMTVYTNQTPHATQHGLTAAARQHALRTILHATVRDDLGRTPYNLPDLTRHFGVSTRTIQRDLATLATTGSLTTTANRTTAHVIMQDLPQQPTRRLPHVRKCAVGSTPLPQQLLPTLPAPPAWITDMPHPVDLHCAQAQRISLHTDDIARIANDTDTILVPVIPLHTPISPCETHPRLPHSVSPFQTGSAHIRQGGGDTEKYLRSRPEAQIPQNTLISVCRINTPPRCRMRSEPVATPRTGALPKPPAAAHRTGGCVYSVTDQRRIRMHNRMQVLYLPQRGANPLRVSDRIGAPYVREQSYTMQGTTIAWTSVVPAIVLAGDVAAGGHAAPWGMIVDCPFAAGLLAGCGCGVICAADWWTKHAADVRLLMPHPMYAQALVGWGTSIPVWTRHTPLAQVWLTDQCTRSATESAALMGVSLRTWYRCAAQLRRWMGEYPDACESLRTAGHAAGFSRRSGVLGVRGMFARTHYPTRAVGEPPCAGAVFMDVHRLPERHAGAC